MFSGIRWGCIIFSCSADISPFTNSFSASKKSAFNKCSELIKKYKLGETIDFKDSLIDGTKLKITNVEVKERFVHQYQEKIGKETNTYDKIISPIDMSTYKKVIMRLETEYVKNDSSEVLRLVSSYS
mgnify:CR=1 FL=1